MHTNDPFNGQNAAIVVIGGGVIGQSIALEIVRQGANVLLICPQDRDGDSATLAAGAMIDASGELTETAQDRHAQRKLRFRMQAQEMHAEWLGMLREMSGHDIFVRRGLFMIANAGGRKDEENVRKVKQALDACGKPAEWTEPQAVPGLDPHQAYAARLALFIPEDFSLDVDDLMAALAGALGASGRYRRLWDRVTGVEPTPRCAGTWSVHTHESGTIETGAVVVCAGAHVPQVLTEETLSTLRLPTLYFAKGIGAVVSGAPQIPYTIRTPNRSDACGLHVVPRANKGLYIGASTHYGHAAAAVRGITPGEVSAILGDTTREINRRLRDATIASLRYGLRPVCGDGLPLVGQTPLPGLYLATGTFRTGIVMAPRIARIVAAEVTGKAAPYDNPFGFDSARQRQSATTQAGADINVALLRLNEGLAHYNRWRATDLPQDRQRALAVWRQYEAMLGARADPRIIALIERLEAADAQETAAIAAEVW